MNTSPTYRKRTTTTKITVDEEYYPVWQPPRGRTGKAKPTTDAQQVINERRSLQHFIQIVNNNFDSYRDLKVELTYSDKHKPADLEQARKKHNRFIRRLRRWYENHGIDLKYVVVDEIGKNGTMRPHHHMLITGGIDYKTLKEVWSYGSINVAPIDYAQYGSDSWCTYVYKDPRYCSKWRGSKNLEQPAVKERDSGQNRKTAAAYLKAFKSGRPFTVEKPGYTLDKFELVENPYNKDVYVRIRWVKEGVS